MGEEAAMGVDSVFGLSGKHALIVGAGKVPHAIADLFRQAGAAVAHEPDPVMTEIGVSALLARHPSLDILVNGAVVCGPWSIETLAMEEWDRVHQVNVRGAYLLMREAVRAMRAHGRGGRLINISTIGSVHPVLNGNFAYGASRAGTNALTRQFALDFAGEASGGRLRARPPVGGQQPFGHGRLAPRQGELEQAEAGDGTEDDPRLVDGEGRLGRGQHRFPVLAAPGQVEDHDPAQALQPQEARGLGHRPDVQPGLASGPVRTAGRADVDVHGGQRPRRLHRQARAAAQGVLDGQGLLLCRVRRLAGLRAFDDGQAGGEGPQPVDQARRRGQEAGAALRGADQPHGRALSSARRARDLHLQRLAFGDVRRRPGQGEDRIGPRPQVEERRAQPALHPADPGHGARARRLDGKGVAALDQQAFRPAVQQDHPPRLSGRPVEVEAARAPAHRNPSPSSRQRVS